MFATPDLAARIDRAEARLSAGVADAAGGVAIEVGGGLAVFAGDMSPSNKLIGAGFAAAPSGEELERAEREFAERGAALQAEVATLAAPAFHSALIGRGYAAHGFENVLGRRVDGHLAETPSGIAVDVLGVSERTLWVEALIDAFAAPDAGGVGGDTVPASDALRRWTTLTASVDGFECVAARIGGRIAGAAAWRADRGIAQLCGAGTLPEFRRRGVQTALLRWRLRRASELGCSIAVVTTQPASKSQQNVQREGFSLLYARQLLVKPAPRSRGVPSVSRSASQASRPTP